MKKEFSTHWVSSKQPRKQRKYVAKAPLHIKSKLLCSNLSKELRKKYGKRNLRVRKGDVVKVMVGKYKGKQGKVSEITVSRQRLLIDGIQVKKQDGSKVSIPFKPSNLQIIELSLDDKKRIGKSKDEKILKEKNKVEKKVGEKNAP